MKQEMVQGKLENPKIEKFLENALLARLATAVPSKEDPSMFQPHNTPVWFLWDGESLFISAFTSTRKVKEVRRNPYIAVLIDVEKTIDGIQAVLMEGKCDWIPQSPQTQEISRAIYVRYMGEGANDPAPRSWVVDPENSLIKLTPQNIYSW